MSVKPVSPSEALDLKVDTTPDFVFEAWNRVIVRNLKDGVSKFFQSELIFEILDCSNDGELTSFNVTDRGWLDMEPVFRRLGWKVVYDKPGYNEIYEPFFEFTLPNNQS